MNAADIIGAKAAIEAADPDDAVDTARAAKILAVLGIGISAEELDRLRISNPDLIHFTKQNGVARYRLARFWRSPEIK